MYFTTKAYTDCIFKDANYFHVCIYLCKLYVVYKLTRERQRQTNTYEIDVHKLRKECDGQSFLISIWVSWIRYIFLCKMTHLTNICFLICKTLLHAKSWIPMNNHAMMWPLKLSTIIFFTTEINYKFYTLISAMLIFS